MLWYEIAIEMKVIPLTFPLNMSFAHFEGRQCIIERSGESEGGEEEGKWGKETLGKCGNAIPPFYHHRAPRLYKVNKIGRQFWYRPHSISLLFLFSKLRVFTA